MKTNKKQKNQDTKKLTTLPSFWLVCGLYQWSQAGLFPGLSTKDP